MDAIDKKLLLQLMKNSRAPISRLAKTPGLTRERIRHRLPKLVELGVIKSFITRIHQPAFCKGIANFTAKLVRFDTIRLEEIIKTLKKNPQINWITELCGNADIMCTILYKDLDQLSKTISEITSIIGKNLQDHQLSLYIHEYKFDRSGLLTGEKTLSQEDSVRFSEKDIPTFTKEDLIILSKLAKNARIKNVDLSEAANISEDVVRLRIKNLEKKGIIKGYTIVLDPSKLGFEGYQIGMNLEQMTKQTISHLISYVNSNPYIIFCARTSGKFNIMLELEVKDRLHFKKVLQELRSEFKDNIKNYEFQLSLNDYKEVFVPEGFFI